MKISRSFLSAAILAIVAVLFTTPATAHADTYQIFDLGNADRTDIIGITTSGTVVLLFNVPVGAPLCQVSHICQEYETWVNGVMVNDSPTAPNFVYDNGTPCVPDESSPLVDFSSSVCNNGHEVYTTGPTTAAPYTYATFTGPDVTDLFALFPIAVEDVNLNSSGDFVYNRSHPTGGSGELLEAIDLTTDQVPEPGSILLLGTGILTALSFPRRQQQE
jgi:hypothetical protein